MNVAVAKPFRTMVSREKVDLGCYVTEFMKAHPECRLYVGSDSQNVGKQTVYVTTVVMRFPGMGAHVIYRKERLERITDLWTKLWGETERSVEVACFLRDTCHLTVERIDLDFNSDPEYSSNKLLSASSGYVQSLGFKSAAKPELLMAAWAANVLCQR